MIANLDDVENSHLIFFIIFCTNANGGGSKSGPLVVSRRCKGGDFSEKDTVSDVPDVPTPTTKVYRTRQSLVE